MRIFEETGAFTVVHHHNRIISTSKCLGGDDYDVEKGLIVDVTSSLVRWSPLGIRLDRMRMSSLSSKTDLISESWPDRMESVYSLWMIGAVRLSSIVFDNCQALGI